MAQKYLDYSGLQYLWTKIKNYIDSHSGGGTSVADYIVEQGTTGNWYYEKYNSGICKAWYNSGSTTTTCATSSGNGWYRNSSAYTISTSALGLVSTQFCTVTVDASLAYVVASVVACNPTHIQYYVGHLGSYSDKTSWVYAEIVGRWK